MAATSEQGLPHFEHQDHRGRYFRYHPDEPELRAYLAALTPEQRAAVGVVLASEHEDTRIGDHAALLTATNDARQLARDVTASRAEVERLRALLAEAEPLIPCGSIGGAVRSAIRAALTTTPATPGGGEKHEQASATAEEANAISNVQDQVGEETGHRRVRHSVDPGTTKTEADPMTPSAAEEERRIAEVRRLRDLAVSYRYPSTRVRIVELDAVLSRVAALTFELAAADSERHRLIGIASKERLEKERLQHECRDLRSEQELDRLREANIRQGAALRAAEAERDELQAKIAQDAWRLAEAEAERVGKL